ncbi:unnamed protein product, partial [Polarella glacialis]
SLCQAKSQPGGSTQSPPLTKSRTLPDVVSFNATISACARAAQWQHGLGLLHSMRGHMLEPDAVSFSASISALDGARRWDGALALLCEMLEAGVRADVVAFSATISALSKSSQWLRALAVLSSMEQHRTRPNAVACAAAMAACDRGGRWESALAVLQQLQQQRLRMDVVAYTSAISACGKGSQWFEALRLFRLSCEHLAPNVIMLNATISSCEKGLQWLPALRLLEQMPQANLEPDVVSFNAAMRACERCGLWERTLCLFSELGTRASLKPDAASFNAVLGAACDSSHPLLAAELFESAVGGCVYPGLLAKGSGVLDVHDLSPGAAGLAVNWWLEKVGYWRGSHPPGLEIIPGWGQSHKSWSTSNLKESVEKHLDRLGVPWTHIANRGRLRLLPRTPETAGFASKASHLPPLAPPREEARPVPDRIRPPPPPREPRTCGGTGG